MACPSDDDLSSYLAGRIVDVEADQLAAHVAQCRSCEALGGTVTPPLGSVETLAAGPRAHREHQSADPAAGDAVGGYILQRRIGAGGMGVVWEAYDPELDRTVAIKLMRDAAPYLRARFEQETRITARLQHPSIVNIFEAGSWRGEPYYVMKLVHGVSLDATLARLDTIEDRLGMLPSIISVIDAVAYAHGARVIHRDLKPDNILVGEFGETVVIDWGLAKELAARTSTPSLSATSRSSDETTVGAVLGTPSYMPPEQARGEPVDARADVYALGAILYFMLSGKRPYVEAQTGEAILAAVLEGPPAALPAGAPADLVTIVHKAMARDAGDRYATAKELAVDLKRFQTGQLVGSHRYSPRELVARWVRRHRAAVSVAAAAALLLVGAVSFGVRRIVHERTHATDARAHAEKQRAEVEKLLTFMLGDLRKELTPIGKVALLEKVATQAVTYFEGQRSGEGDQHVRVRAQLALGDVFMSTARTPRAFESYRLAEGIARTQWLLAPADRTLRRDVADVDSKIGMAYWQQGAVDRAVSAFREQQQILQQLSTEDPSDARDRDLASTHDLLGSMLLEQGDRDGALAQLTSGLALAETIAARDPGDASKQRDLALSSMKLGSVLIGRGELDAAIARFERSIAIMDKVVGAAPDALEYRRELAIDHSRLGTARTAKGERVASLSEHKLALELFRTIARREPANARYQADVANQLSYVASLIKGTSQDEALGNCREARAIREGLVARDPTNAELQNDLLGSAQQTSLLLLAMKRPEEALPQVETAVRIGKELVHRDPTRVRWKTRLLLSQAAQAEILEALGRMPRAIMAQREALVLAEQVLAADPTNVEAHEDVADAHEALGRLSWSTERATAIVEYRAALAIFETLARDAPNDHEWTERVESITRRLGTK